MQPSVTLETKCWEQDWEFLLRTRRIEQTIERSRFNFAKRTLCINNVDDVGKVCRYAQKLVNSGILTDFLVVAEKEKSALDFYQLPKESLTSGFVYSIAELVGLYMCETDYLLHFSGDSRPTTESTWLASALSRMESDARAKVANLTWNGNYAEAAAESFAEDDDFYIGYGFSDQMYLVRTSDFRRPDVYHDTNPMSARYPKYGGELFEKRVDSWMRNHDYYRLTYRHASYLHKNFPRTRWKKKSRLLLERLGVGR
ncbi:MAG TPA: hypothetical protein VM099_04345 [Gemmatimonadaceae bacterium]|nr:hypothetical protein [Gemmatimonadaceae bacterium]